jgi:hypothetical protein
MTMIEAARLLSGYAKSYNAGAFATPTLPELARSSVRRWRGPGQETVVVSKRLTRDTRRRDFTGTSHPLAGGSLVVTHLARTRGAPVPSLRAYDYVNAYQEDRDLVAGLGLQGFRLAFVQVSAAGEVIGCYHRGPPIVYRRVDVATVEEVAPWNVPGASRRSALAEVAAVARWHDDYPYYNRDGSWTSASLRGFRPDDPGWSVKPSEMSKAWWRENPGAAKLRCDWTVLAERCPALVGLVTGVPWWREVERVRLLRMTRGTLLRHTDITDRTAGTRDGQIARFHLPLVTDPGAVLLSWDLHGRQRRTHLSRWKLWYLDQRKPHAVVNDSDTERIHLVVDVVVDEHVRQRIAP